MAELTKYGGKEMAELLKDLIVNIWVGGGGGDFCSGHLSKL
jgi:hypothetical protein